MLLNLSRIFSSAQNALMIRSPPKVSSTTLIVSLHNACALILCAFNLRPIHPMNQPIIGMIITEKSVSCQEMIIKVVKYERIKMGFLNIKSRDDMMLVSTSCTSPVMRAMISPLRSSVKKPKGRRTILLYSWLRMSRTTPVRIGTTLEEARK